MYVDQIQAVELAGKKKIAFITQNFWEFFLASILAGAFIGFGILLSFTVGGLLKESNSSKLAMGSVFGIALSLVVIAGAELFTGNNFILGVGLLRQSVTWLDASRLWLWCWLGNAVGAILLAIGFHYSGLQTGSVAQVLAAATVTKMSLGIVPLVLRGIFCNMLVCLAIWSGFQCKSEAGKLIMIFWCLLAFFTTGFEHSVANMTVLTAGLLDSTSSAITISGWFYNLFWVTLGNMIGGILFVAYPYVKMAQKLE